MMMVVRDVSSTNGVGHVVTLAFAGFPDYKPKPNKTLCQQPMVFGLKC